MKHDEHYRAIEQNGIEPIRIMEELHGRLLKLGVSADAALNITLAQKHITRAGMKAGNDWSREIEKAINYLTRAKTGEWVDSGSLSRLTERNSKLHNEIAQLKKELDAALNSQALLRDREEVLLERERFNDNDFSVASKQMIMYFNGKVYGAVAGDHCSYCHFYEICGSCVGKQCDAQYRSDKTSVVWVEKS